MRNNLFLNIAHEMTFLFEKILLLLLLTANHNKHWGERILRL